VKRRTNPQRGSRFMTPLAKRPLRPQSHPDFSSTDVMLPFISPEHTGIHEGELVISIAGWREVLAAIHAGKLSGDAEMLTRLIAEMEKQFPNP
jgi:hypothetical protein